MSTDDSSESKTALLRILQLFLTFVVGIGCAANAQNQAQITGLSSAAWGPLLQTDLAVLDRQQPRRDLPCAVTMRKPELGFDFLFHTGYEASVPVRELAGEGNELTVLFRVVSQDHPDDPFYVAGSIRVPAIEEHGRREVTFYDNLALGEGKFHVDWLMRDQRDRVCAMSWDLEAKLNSKDGQLRQWIPQALVQLRGPLFAAEPPVIRAPGNGLLRFSIIVNFDPPNSSAGLIDDQGLDRLLAILRRIGRDPRVEPYSITICSLETQKVVYQQENKGGIDLPALEVALASARLGTVDAKRLASNNGPAQFAADLIREQLDKENTDGLIVLGPKGGAETGVSPQALDSFDKLGKPAFYLSYDTKQRSSLWRDPISSIMKHLRGFEYGINRPKDFFNAWSDVVSRIMRAKQAPQASIAATVAAR